MGVVPHVLSISALEGFFLLLHTVALCVVVALQLGQPILFPKQCCELRQTKSLHIFHVCIPGTNGIDANFVCMQCNHSLKDHLLAVGGVFLKTSTGKEYYWNTLESNLLDIQHRIIIWLLTYSPTINYITIWFGSYVVATQPLNRLGHTNHFFLPFCGDLSSFLIWIY